MELEEMREVWQELTDQLESQKKLNSKMIKKMTELQYKNSISKIVIPEIIGALICFAATLYILINFQKLDTWYLMVSAFFSIFILIFLPIMSLRALKNLYTISPAKYSYKEMIVNYRKEQNRFKFVQKLAIYLSFLLMFAIIPVSLKLISNKDLSELNYQKLLWILPIGILLFIWVTRWAYRCYNTIMKSTDDLLSELDN